MSAEPMMVSITGCARCHGKGHADLTFAPLTHPFEMDDEPDFTHWTACPANGEPILLRTQPKPPA